MNLLKQYADGKRDFTDANLADAFLAGANLTGANLTDANLADANLTGANLTDTNLARVNLTGANLARANLTGANLARANLTDANLAGANLTDTNLAGANLGSPAQILAARWGDLSRSLTRAAMRYDAANHPNPEAFLVWANGGTCPYTGLRITRCVSFQEWRELFTPDLLDKQALSAYELMIAIIREKCADSDYHDHK